jgi:hypothetical protein
MLLKNISFNKPKNLGKKTFFLLAQTVGKEERNLVSLKAWEDIRKPSCESLTISLK